MLGSPADQCTSSGRGGKACHFDVLANDTPFAASDCSRPAFNAASLETWQELFDFLCPSCTAHQPHFCCGMISINLAIDSIALHVPSV